MLAKLTVAFDRIAGRRSYRIHRAIYRWTSGLIGHRTMAGPMLLLTTVGRKSGQARTTPLLYMTDGAGYLVVGSNGGRERPPAWLLNLTATPSVELQVGRRKGPAEARVLGPEEAAALWPRLLEHYKGWSYYQQLTQRELKVVSLSPRGLT
jgi:deazaflavin-dependent oxidoreductase (nitroreductase family)